MGVEPTHLAWKAKVLPLDDTRIFTHSEMCDVDQGGIEPPFLGLQPSALPTELPVQTITTGGDCALPVLDSNQ